MADTSSPSGSDFHETNSRGFRHVASRDELPFQVNHTSGYRTPGPSIERSEVSAAPLDESPYFDTFRSGDSRGPSVIPPQMSGLGHVSASPSPWSTFDMSAVNGTGSPQFDHSQLREAVIARHTFHAENSMSLPMELSNPNDMLNAAPHVDVQVSRATGNNGNREAARRYRERRGNRVADLEQKLLDAEQKIHELQVENARLAGQIDILSTPESRRRG